MKSQRRQQLQTGINTLSPLQRRRMLRTAKYVRHLRWSRVWGVVLGLSVSIQFFANSTQGTHALLTAQAVNAQNQFSAAKHFQKYDDDIAANAERAARSASLYAEQAHDASTAVGQAATASEAESHVNDVKSAETGAEAALNQAMAFKNQIDEIASEDLQDYEAAESQAQQAMQDEQQIKDEIAATPQANTSSVKSLSVALNKAESRASQLQAVAESFQRVMSWSALADGQAARAIQTAQSAAHAAAEYASSAESMVAQKKDAENSARQQNGIGQVNDQHASGPASQDNSSPSADSTGNQVMGNS